MKKALITGITVQDGSYLAEFLIDRGYQVHGIKRRTSLINTDRIDHLYHDLHNASPQLILHYGDMTDAANLIRVTFRDLVEEMMDADLKAVERDDLVRCHGHNVYQYKD
jgi:GDP-mannose 4,6-dehydratase